MKSEKISSTKTIMGLAAVLIVVIAVIVFYSEYRLETVEYRAMGGNMYSQDELDSLIFTSCTDMFTLFFEKRIQYGRYKKIPFIEKIDVEKTDKNSCIIYVYYEAVTGCFEVMQQYMYFDREGNVVESASERLEGIPLIKGFTFSNIVIGKKPDINADYAFDRILDITLLLNKYSLAAEDIEFNERHEVTIHIGGHTVRLGNREAYNLQIANLGAVISSVEENDRHYIFDMRNYDEHNMNVTARQID